MDQAGSRKAAKVSVRQEKHKRRHRQNVNQETKLTNNVFGTAGHLLEMQLMNTISNTLHVP